MCSIVVKAPPSLVTLALVICAAMDGKVLARLSIRVTQVVTQRESLPFSGHAAIPEEQIRANGGSRSRTLRPEEALESSTDAVQIYRRLAGVHPAAFEPDLARTLNNLATPRGTTGQPGCPSA